MKKSLLLGGSLACTVFIFNPSAKAAQDYLGADAVLKKIAAASGVAATPVEESPELAKLKSAFKSFKEQSAIMKPEDAAKAWLNLLDQQTKLPPTAWRSRSGRPAGEGAFSPQDIWKALPPPPTWEALRKAIEARPPAKPKDAARESGLKLFAHTLMADSAAQRRDVAELEAIFTKASADESYQLAHTLDTIADLMMENSGDAAATLKTLERRLARTSSEDSRQELSLPDLVALIGPAKAEAFIKKALGKPNVELEIQEGEATQKLARKLALEMVDQLKAPQWQLACSLDASVLYEAMEKKFAPKDEGATNAAAAPDEGLLVTDHMRQLNRFGGPQQEAQTYYFLGLIVSDRTKDAVALAQKLGRGGNVYLPREALKSLDRAGHTRAIHQFFFELLSKNPDLPFWDEYIQFAARVGETGKMLELARAAAARDDLTDQRRSQIRQNLYAALLAADHIDEALKEIRQILADKDTKLAGRYGNEGASRASTALQLARLGQLLARPELTEEGIHIARESLSAEKEGQSSYESPGLRVELATLLAELGRGPEAESYMVEALTAAQKKPASRYGGGDGVAYLIELVELYHQAGRHTDVVLLLEQSPDWGVKNLANIYSRYNHSYGQAIEDPMGLKLARITVDSLLAAGRKAEACKIVDALLDHNGGFDPAYELLIKIGGNDLLARLDAIFAQDQFEERPLIWKAHLLKQAGKFDEAEAAVRRAISIDPSDGEQGPGRRMRAYAVLADIREARGDQKQAEFFRGAVDAIRLSEKADRYQAAGLLKQAVKMYEDSLTHFADAYCIQSRLALRLSELGLNTQAEEHYRRAYELMPDSFGRVESHCFGCEKAFDGERAQGIAEKVFSGLTKTTPEKPQVHYLLGYLREEQGRYAEALDAYRQAVKLDPDYLNAWKHIESAGARNHMPTADRDAVVFNLLRLDPLGLHDGTGDFRKVTDLRGLWVAVEKAAKKQPAKIESLYPFSASKQKLEKAEADQKELNTESRYYPGGFNDYDTDYFSRGRNPLQPAQAVLQTSMIAAALPLVGSDSDYGSQFEY